MATLLEPSAGRVTIDGIDVALEPERVRRIIGYMPDHAGVYERITVREFLEFFADAYRLPKAAWSTRCWSSPSCQAATIAWWRRSARA